MIALPAFRFRRVSVKIIPILLAAVLAGCATPNPAVPTLKTIMKVEKSRRVKGAHFNPLGPEGRDQMIEGGEGANRIASSAAGSGLRSPGYAYEDYCVLIATDGTRAVVSSEEYAKVWPGKLYEANWK
jgi:hypothetical protein